MTARLVVLLGCVLVVVLALTYAFLERPDLLTNAPVYVEGVGSVLDAVTKTEE